MSNPNTPTIDELLHGDVDDLIKKYGRPPSRENILFKNCRIKFEGIEIVEGEAHEQSLN